MSTLIRVLVVDDHQIVRRGLATLLIARNGMQVVGEAATGEEAITKARALNPEVILMDLRMPGMGGAEAMRILRAEMPAAYCLVLTTFSEDEHLSAALQAGARGYLYKDTSPDELFEAIRAVAKGAFHLPQEIIQKLVRTQQESKSKAQVAHSLTKRELDVLGSLAKGMSNREIADFHFVSIATVRSHVRNLLDKLDVSNRTEAAVYAVESGLLDQRVLSA
jgi:DNA-binding NarL/FixJ family response regulator